MDASNSCGSPQIKKNFYMEPLARAKRSNVAILREAILKLLKSNMISYSLASLTEVGLAPTGIPCLCSTSYTTSRMSLLYESKSKTFDTTLAKPS